MRFPTMWYVDWKYRSDVLEFSGMNFVCINEPRHEISYNVVCSTSKASDQPAHTRSLIRAFDCCLNIIRVLDY